VTRQEFNKACANRETTFGCYILEYMRPQTARILALAGYDWIWIDNEHCAHSYESIQEVIRTAHDVGITSIVRVGKTDYSRIAQIFDIGADGIIVPRVETPEQARTIIDAAKFPPKGKRGFGMRPLVFNTMSISMADSIADQNDTRFVIVQIESRKGVENLEAILDIAEGNISAVMLGPADFQIDIGKVGQPDTPEFEEAAQRVSDICAARGIPAGIPAGSVDHAHKWIARGYSMVCLGSDDGFMVAGAARTVKKLRG